jgi:hypothetical protein
MPTSIIAYGRVSTSGQTRNRDVQYQQVSIQSAFPNSDVAFALDECPGHTPLANRTAFTSQYQLAAQQNLPLYLEHPDRLFKTYDPEVLRPAVQYLQARGVLLLYVRSNEWIQSSVWKLLLDSPSPDAHLLPALMLRIQQYLEHRKITQSPKTLSAPIPARRSWEWLKTRRSFPCIRTCAGRILALRSLPIVARNFYLNAYLGALYNEVYIHGRALRARRRVRSSGQRQYFERASDERLFQRIRQLESVPNFTRDGRPKRVTDQSIATTLAAEGFQNLRGAPVGKKNVYDIRRSEAYRLWASGDALVPILPDLGA